MMSLGAGLGFVGIAGVAALWCRDQRRLRDERACFFDDCLPSFETYRVMQSSPAFPELEGQYRGSRVRLVPFVDDLTWRKLPCLWLQLTMFRDMPHAGTLDILARPRGTEFYSPSADLPIPVTPPSDWPSDMAIRTDDAQRMPPLAVLERHVAMFDDPFVKELVITPRGVRLVVLVAQARRANYAVLRQIDLGGVRLERATAERHLDAALALIADLASAATQQAA